MLTYKDILDSFTLKLSTAFSDVEIYTDNTTNGIDDNCFYVSLIPTTSNAFTKKTDKKNLLVSIKYFPKVSNNIELYNAIDLLNKEFSRNIQVKDRFLHFSSIEPNVISDDVGSFLDFLINISYVDDIYIDEEILPNVNEVIF